MSHQHDDRVVTTTVTTHGGSDMRAAYTGLIVGAIALLAVVTTIVTLTNRKFAGEHEAAAHAPGAAAPTTPH
jgi:hypothetical protein